MAQPKQNKKTASVPSMKSGAKKNSSPKSKGKKGSQLFVWIFILVVLALGAYLVTKRLNQDLSDRAIPSLPAEMSVAEVASLDPQEWFFLDVREPEEWEAGHIEWARLIPLGELSDRVSELPRDKQIVTVCRSGNRSAQARDILLKLGFTTVTSMAGGMNEWQARGYPVVTGP